MVDLILTHIQWGLEINLFIKNIMATNNFWLWYIGTQKPKQTLNTVDVNTTIQPQSTTPQAWSFQWSAFKWWGWTVGTPDISVDPNKYITREKAMQMIADWQSQWLQPKDILKQARDQWYTIEWMAEAQRKTVLNKYTENLRTQASQKWSFWGTAEVLMNPIWAWFEAIDTAIQKIPVYKSADNSWIKDFAVNLVPSVLKMASSTTRAVTNPFDTLSWLTQLVWTEEWREWLKNYFVDRYWSLEWLSNYARQDPAWIASDLLTVVSWWASLVWKTAWLAWKWASIAWKLGTAKNLADVAWDLWRIATKADNLSSLWLSPVIQKWIGKVWVAGQNLIDQWWMQNKISGNVLKYWANAVLDPLKNVPIDAKKVKQVITRDIPSKIVANKLSLTPNERARVEQTWTTPENFMLDNKLASLWTTEQVNALQSIADNNYNIITSELKKVPNEVRLKSAEAKKVLWTMIREMEWSEIVKSEYPDYINKLKALTEQDDYSLPELNAIRRDFDRIVWKQIFDSKWRISWQEDNILAWWRRKLSDDLSNEAEKYWIDIKKLNTDMRNSINIRDWIIRADSQRRKNNFIGIQDLGVWAILSAWDPVSATAYILGKKSLENLAPWISQRLYNLNKEKYVPNNMKRGVRISTNDTANGFSVTPDINMSKWDVQGLEKPKRIVRPKKTIDTQALKKDLSNKSIEPSTTKELEPLYKEAKKYKSAEEFQKQMMEGKINNISDLSAKARSDDKLLKDILNKQEKLEVQRDKIKAQFVKLKNKEWRNIKEDASKEGVMLDKKYKDLNSKIDILDMAYKERRDNIANLYIPSYEWDKIKSQLKQIREEANKK